MKFVISSFSINSLHSPNRKKSTNSCATYHFPCSLKVYEAVFPISYLHWPSPKDALRAFFQNSFINLESGEPFLCLGQLFLKRRNNKAEVLRSQAPSRSMCLLALIGKEREGFEGLFFFFIIIIGNDLSSWSVIYLNTKEVWQ